MLKFLTLTRGAISFWHLLVAIVIGTERTRGPAPQAGWLAGWLAG